MVGTKSWKVDFQNRYCYVVAQLGKKMLLKRLPVRVIRLYLLLNGQFYLDYQQDSKSLPNIYNYDPTEEVKDPALQKLILGVQGNIWCEWIPSRERMQYMTVPRMIAIAELGWRRPVAKELGRIAQRLGSHFERLNVMNINFTEYPIWKVSIKTNAFIGEDSVAISCIDPSAKVYYTTDGSTRHSNLRNIQVRFTSQKQPISNSVHSVANGKTE